MMLSKRFLAVAAIFALFGCTGSAPNTGVGERLGAKGRIVGYFYDADTGAPLADVTLTTFELTAEVTARTANGFAVLDDLTAGTTYRVLVTKDGYVTRFFNIAIGQVPQDAYDAVSVGNIGSVAMLKPSGVINGRAEFLTNGPNPLPIANARVIVDLVNNGGFQLSKSVVTDASGAFSVDGLPASPTGQTISVCLISGADAVTNQIEFNPLCTNGTAYSGQASFLVLRPSRVDLNNGDLTIYQGVVRDQVSRLPLADVQVFEVGKETEAVTTDANGFYLLRSTSLNRFVQLTYRKMGYAEGYQELNVGRGTNQNLSLSLYPGGASITGRLLYANLLPANNAEVRIDLRTSHAVNVFRTVRASAMGDFTIDNLPGLPDGLNVTITVTPWSADPELFPETSAQSFNVTMYPAAATPVFRQLSSNANLTVIANNTYSGFIGTTEPVQLLMTLPTIPADNSFTLVDSNSGATMPFTVTYADNNRRITVTPTVGGGTQLWSEARSYNLTVRLRANNGPTGLLNTSFTFTPRSSLQTSAITGRIMTMTVDTPDIDANSRTFTLRWAPLPDAFSYSLYVRTVNTPRLPSFVRMGTANSGTAPNFPVNFGAYSFTSALEPAVGQPFGFGQVLQFLVVPVDSRGIETDASKGATLDLRDVVGPRFAEGVAQLDDGVGAGRVRFVVRSVEPMERNNPPMTTLPSGLTVTQWSVDETTGGVEGTLTLTGSITPPATLSLQLKDTSGNASRALAVPVFATALVPSFGFEGASAGTCGSTGWTTETIANCGGCPSQVLMSGPAPAVAVPGTLSTFEGTCALSFGDSDATFCATQGTTATVDLSNAALFDRRQVTLMSRYWGFINSGSANYQLSLQNLTTMATPVNTSLFANTNRTWIQNSTDLTSLPGAQYRLRLGMGATSCNTRAALQIDDVKVFVK